MIVNRTSHPDAEIERFVTLGMADLHLPDVIVEVSKAPADADLLGFNRKFFSEEGTDGNLIVVRVPEGRGPDGRSGARDWREWVV